MHVDSTRAAFHSCEWSDGVNVAAINFLGAYDIGVGPATASIANSTFADNDLDVAFSKGTTLYTDLDAASLTRAADGDGAIDNGQILPLTNLSQSGFLQADDVAFRRLRQVRPRLSRQYAISERVCLNERSACCTTCHASAASHETAH